MINRQPNEQELRAIEQTQVNYPTEQGNVWDGIVDFDKFCQAPCKILWILKETNGTDFSDLRDALCNQAKKNRLDGFRYTYSKVVQVSHAILTGDWSNTKKANALCGDILPQIAVINVKKQGGNARANGSVIHDHYKHNKDLLLRQISAINPHLIISANGNTDLFAALNPIQECKISAFTAAYQQNSGRVLIAAYHPGYRKITCRDYLELIHQILQKYPLC